ncbi:PD-(D/E)XK nuclease domain-containing protein [Mesorhizobium sp. L-8-3]|uniref:PD-(D/E)XK nuclease domain-containing protein n=1 Tax=Mesorhizobium sp. L-8-3 TaxID=2744522 RepID=UPI00192755C4|nr:hypothetical protein [Mesorhizobium sp. L-8-3]BCH27641.1 hypothetical protein MesoLjLb_74260 [Mesorhizobium sp. L-8-3]
MRIFGYDFTHIDESHLEDLGTLERERAIYADHWIEELHDFRHVRIRLTESEVTEYVRAMKAMDTFHGSGATWARDVPTIPSDIAERADSYSIRTRDGKTYGPPWHCAAAFCGREIEEILCFSVARMEVIEELGTAAFLSTIRRAVDALTPSIRAFENREKGLATWPIMREDDVRDLLYAMLRASISDIKREEPIPSKAGASRVADLHSPVARTLIEVKWIGRRGRRVLDEIHIDIQTYGRHPECDHLVFVVVDAARDVPDPHLAETQIKGTQAIGGKTLSVTLYIREP